MPPVVVPFLVALTLATAGGARGATFTDVSAARLPQSALAARSMDVEFGDADGDGDLDAFVALEFAPNLLLLNDGTFAFTVAAGAIPARNEDSEDVVLGDYDRDGDLDVVFTSEDTPVCEYYVNDGSGRFSPGPGALPTGIGSNSGATADLDADGDLDLVLASNAGPERVLLNDGTGRFADATAAWIPGPADVTQDVELADVDRDGRLDLLVANEPQDGGRNRLYLHAGDRFVDATDRIPVSETREETREVALATLDVDLDLDVVYGNVDFQVPSRAPDRLLINDGSGRFTDESAARLPAPALATLDVDLADVDGDGDLDLLAANFGAGLQVLRNDGTGRFADATADVLGAAAVGRNSIDVELVHANGRRWLYDAGFNAVDRLLRADAPAAAIVTAHSGAWFDAAHPGHGFHVAVLAAQLVVTWFTYDSDGDATFVIAQGPVPPPGDAASLPAFRGRGMAFRTFDAAGYVLEPWGTLAWEALSCDRGVVEYASALPAADGRPLGRGRIPVQRLFASPGTGCS